MALELKISVLSYDKKNHIVTLSDDTQDYDPGGNPGGYGPPNPERLDCALVVSVVRYYNGLEEVQWVDPLTDTELTFKFKSDGVYSLYLCCLEYEPGVYDVNDMSLGRVFYSVLDDQVYEVIDLGNGVNGLKKTNDVVNNSLSVSDALIYNVSSYLENKKISFLIEDIKSCEKKLSDTYYDVVKSLEGADCHFKEGCYNEAEGVFLFSTKIKK